MNITKDEARILASAINDFKFRINAPNEVFNSLEKLENKLNTFSKDKRRNGRTSQDDWSDLLKRFSKK